MVRTEGHVSVECPNFNPKATCRACDEKNLPSRALQRIVEKEMRKVRVSSAFQWPMTNPLTWNVMLIFFNLNRKIKIMPRAWDDETFVIEVDINAGLKWWLREARGFHINIWWCIGFSYSSVGVILLHRDFVEDSVVFIVSCLDSAVIKLGPTGHVVWLNFRRTR